MKASSYVVLTFRFQAEDDGRWTGYCEELGTATFGRSLKETKTSLIDAVTCHLNALDDVGERARFFKEHGITFHHTARMPETVPVRVPIDDRVYVQSHLQRVNA